MLADLTDLTDLDLSGNKTSDISVLAGLTNLTSLNLEENKINEISQLGNLINMTSLDLRLNEIVDISVLAKLINLTDLSLSSGFRPQTPMGYGILDLDSYMSNFISISDISVLADLKT